MSRTTGALPGMATAEIVRTPSVAAPRPEVVHPGAARYLKEIGLLG